MFRLDRDSIDKPILQKKRREFAALHSILMHLVQIEFKEGCSATFARDETNNRIGTVMSSLAPIALICPYLERETLVGLILLQKSAHVHIQSLTRILTQLAVYHLEAQNITYRDANALQIYLEPNLGFILKEYFDQGYSLNEFPYQLMGSSSLQNFVHQYEKSVVTTLLWCCNEGHEAKSLEELLRLMNHRKTTQDILSHNFASVHSLYVPVIAARTIQPQILALEGGRGDDITKTESLDKLLTTQLPDNKFQELLSESLPEVLACVLKQIYDPEKIVTDTQHIGALLLKPNPPLGNESLIMNVFNYYDSILPERIPLLSFLSSESGLPDSLERIITEICEPLIKSSAAKVHLRSIQALHGVKLFVRRLMNEAQEPHHKNHLQKQIPFLLWFTVSTLVNWIRKQWINNVSTLTKDSIFTLCLASDDIHIIFQNIISMKDRNLAFKIMEKIMLSTASDLITFITKYDKESFKNSIGNNYKELVQKWLDILGIMTIDFKEQFVDAGKLLVQLNPLPKTEENIFDNIQQNIAFGFDPIQGKDESYGSFLQLLRQFLARDIRTIRGETLKELLTQLKGNRNDISTMIQLLEQGRGLSEDASDSMLHKLVTQLLRLSFSHGKSNL